MKIIFFAISLFLIFQCSGYCQQAVKAIPMVDATTILSVEFHNSGGEMGGLVDFTISKDSTSFFSSGIMQRDGHTFKNRQTNKKKTNSEYWRKLINSINLSDFDNSPNGKSISYIDGIDRILIIKTTKQIHRLIIEDSDNVTKNEYRVIMPFINLLQAKLDQFDNKVEIL